LRANFVTDFTVSPREAFDAVVFFDHLSAAVPVAADLE
jgi:hypothetical protein